MNTELWKDLEETATKTPTPFFLYDRDSITSSFTRIAGSIPGAEIHYAMKANHTPCILRLIRELGGGIDAVSPGEAALALKCGFPRGKVRFTPNSTTADELSWAVTQGLPLTIGSLEELGTLACHHPGTSLSLRFNPLVKTGEEEKVQTGGLKSKFGLLPEEAEEGARICRNHNLKVIGLHKHSGSGIREMDKYLKSVSNLLDVGDKTLFPHLELINLGGGIAPPYRPEDREVDMMDLGKQIYDRFSLFCEKYGKTLRLLLEPGKYITAGGGFLVVKVNLIKNNRGRMIALTDGSFTHLLRPALYGAYHHIFNLTNPRGKMKVYDICGNICESGDKFAEERRMPEIRKGDLLAVAGAGAYGYTMASTYNLRPLPAEVWRDNRGCRVVRKALAFEELAAALAEEGEI